MSDEDRDIDIESDEDDELGANTQFMTQAEKRAHHNALERKRRDHIKESFHSLRDSIPSLQGEKVNSSRAQILKQATDYIQFMCKKNSAHQHDIEDLKRQNNLLDQQVRLFEKTKAAGTFAASQSGGLEGSSGSGSKARGGSSGAAVTSADRLKNQDQSDSSDSETENRQRRKKLKT